MDRARRGLRSRSPLPSAISLLLGHVTTSTAFAVAIARHGGGTTAAPAFKSAQAWLPTLGAALVAFAGAAAVLVLTAPRDVATTGRIPLAIVSSGVRVRVIAIDGVDPRIVDELAAAGRLPSLSRLVSGARARLALDGTVASTRSRSRVDHDCYRHDS